MRIAVYSDLHREVSPFQPPHLDTDVVVLAGDIDNGARGVQWAKDAFDRPVLYVAGNHEYYDGEYYEVQRALALAAHGSRVHVLDCGERIFGTTRFLGCCLWTDYSLVSPDRRAEAIERSRRHNPDHFAIRHGGGPFAPEHAIQLCARHRSWLESKLAEPHPGPTVVITHFGPHPGSIAPKFQSDPANPGFIVPLEPLMGKAALWIHGHTHSAFDYRVAGTRIVCNARGYPDETTGFVADRVVELPALQG
jgi:predicted phosphodiesterase